MQLLAPANEALTNPCLTGPITEYAWVEGICLMSVFALFFVELLTMRYAKSGHSHGEHYSDTHSSSGGLQQETGYVMHDISPDHASPPLVTAGAKDEDARSRSVSEPYAAQLTGVFILEFGVVFHSIFVGLTLALAGEEFTTLYIVFVFHQTFEGIALGSRLASIDWPTSRRWTPYVLGIGYTVSTPIAILVGLGIRSSYNAGSATALITNGIFDSVSAGILIYTGLVELMAHDFIFSSHMQHAPVRETLFAFGAMCCGAGLMALLGKWA